MSGIQCTQNGVNVPCQSVIPGLALKIGLPLLVGFFIAKRTKDMGYGAIAGVATAVVLGSNLHYTPEVAAVTAAATK